MDQILTEKIGKIFDEEGITEKVTCPQVFELAEKHGIEKADIAKYCNINKIKIRECQLGCFK
ncbi:hypothetical protein F1737_00730 [Methanoplanus sp. FWC-SCC4]|uniref:Uncharacterized protein n=1 Tax=Methanochimaera problematica TaxID=2609417 RepID=A0AA97FA01_9EURY|nr:hypothetical protein [Methanoplanus sp. FWC-SCC4]WOF15307.1 hypothetical protein F1737_00730 [Methanoplanus sp. FWC-SCC4]